jgi:hypothetical protein
LEASNIEVKLETISLLALIVYCWRYISNAHVEDDAEVTDKEGGDVIPEAVES